MDILDHPKKIAMPSVFKQDVKITLEECYQKIKRELNIDKPRYDIHYFNDFSGLLERFIVSSPKSKVRKLRPLTSSTLFNKIYYSVTRSSEVGFEINFSMNTLDLLSNYAFDLNWRERFKILKEPIHVTDSVEFAFAMFPKSNPSFPATPTIPIKVPGFRNVFLKDESQNPTGTHKDRMAYEIGKYYWEIIKNSTVGQPRLRDLSLLTYGCAGLAIQTELQKYNYPNLKVLIDLKMDPAVKEALRLAKCEIFEFDLSNSEFSSERILEVTNNQGGFDLTFGKGMEKVKTRYYDWLSFEILNQSPDYCFMPFGSGDLMTNVLYTVDLSLKGFADNYKPNRLFINENQLRKCKFFGGTSTVKGTIMDKLYSPYFGENTNMETCKQIVSKYQDILAPSGVYEVEETFTKKALAIAADNNITCEPSGIAGLGLFLQMTASGTLDIAPRSKVVIVNTGKLKVDSIEN